MNEYFDHEEARRFFKFATLVMILLGVFLLAKSLGAFKDLNQPSATPNTIVVSGEGEAYATPDIASFSFSVSADAKSVADAQGTVTGKINKILASLKNLGIDDKDVQTTDYSVYPKYTYSSIPCSPTYCPPSRQLPDGYSVSHSITLKVRKTGDAGEALSIVGDNGATNISSLNFTVDDPNAIQNEARDKAVQDARSKAEALADSLGVSLGRVVDFSDSTYNPGPYPIAYKTMAADSAGGVSAPTVPSGQTKVTSNVSVTYEIR